MKLCSTSLKMCTHSDQKRPVDPLELELQMIVSCLMWLLGGRETAGAELRAPRSKLTQAPAWRLQGTPLDGDIEKVRRSVKFHLKMAHEKHRFFCVMSADEPFEDTELRNVSHRTRNPAPYT
ncbi:uncharacterized protein LOC143436074 isoform X3 [Arvicanthis niloticus]|uniref:uncharacterized protein LOC143310095 isoform X3 n=1 Tax=Arvicanthis niloticus TaxID=61156 RepID=UPI00402BEEA7